jgi:spore maturation protein CgeB
MEGAMYPQSPPINPYDPKTLDALGEAFDATWVVLQARDPFRDFERESELRTALNQKLVTLVADGVTDPVELREWALESLLLR